MLSSTRYLIAATIFATSIAAHAASQEASPAQPRTIAGPATLSTVDGFVSEVVTKHTAGAPQGTYLLVNGAASTTDVSVGPWLTAAMKQQMVSGSRVHITGLTQTINGKQYLLAQQVTVNGQMYTIRNGNGLLARNHVARNGGAK